MDLTTVDEDDGCPRDSDKRERKQKAMAKAKSEQPTLLVGSPMCTAFSLWQRLNDKIRDPKVCADEKARGLLRLSFCVDLYREQHRNGRYFLHEHPAQATSWQTEVVEKLSKEDGIIRVTCDQC